jgi:hypothetical protein
MRSRRQVARNESTSTPGSRPSRPALVKAEGSSLLMFGLLLPWLAVVVVLGAASYLLNRVMRRSRQPAARLGAAANSPLEQKLALGLAETTPDAVRLADRQGVRPALRDHRATPAHLLGPHLTLGAGAATLPVGMEEHRRVDAPAKS